MVHIVIGAPINISYLLISKKVIDKIQGKISSMSFNQPLWLSKTKIANTWVSQTNVLNVQTGKLTLATSFSG